MKTALFEKKYKVIAVDSRAQGRSGDRGAELTYELMASDVAALLDQLAIDHSGNIYVADDYNHCVRKIATNGQVSTIAGTSETAQFNRPQDVALDAEGNLYVADANNFVVRKITPDGIVSLGAGIPGVSGETDGSR